MTIISEEEYNKQQEATVYETITAAQANAKIQEIWQTDADDGNDSNKTIDIDNTDLDEKTTWQRIKAIARLALSLILSSFYAGTSTLDASVSIQLIAAVLCLFSWIYSWWKNNNITSSAILAQAIKSSINTDTIPEIISKMIQILKKIQ